MPALGNRADRGGRCGVVFSAQWSRRFAVALLSLAPAVASAATPNLGGPMKHIFITLYTPTQTLYHYIQDGETERVLLFDYGETYDGDAAVLDGTHYSGRHGWLADGIWSVPPGRGIFVKLQTQTEGVEVYEENTYTPLFGTAGSSDTWQWDTTMVHNWYAVTACGHYEATYKVYVGDLSGVEDIAYTPTYVTLYWHYDWSPFELAGDADADGDVDLVDFSLFQSCFTGAAGSVASPECGCYDFDVDEDVDLDDYDVVHDSLSSPTG